LNNNSYLFIFIYLFRIVHCHRSKSALGGLPVVLEEL
jgi:hypothetical protein